MTLKVVIISFFIILSANITWSRDADIHFSATKYSLQTSINCLLKDSEGFLWIGTMQGLYRFDGFDYDLINTVRNNGLKISHPNVQCLFEDGSGNLWIGTSNGLNVFNPSRTQIEPLPFNSGQFITVIKQVKNKIWIGTKTGKVLKVNLPINSRAEEESSDFYFDSLKYEFDFKINAIVNDHSGALFILSEDKTILKLTADGDPIKDYTLPFIGQNVCYDDKLKKLIISSRYGIYSIDNDLNDLKLVLPLNRNNPNILKILKVKDDEYLAFSSSDNLFFTFNPSSSAIIDYAPDFQKSVKSHQYLINDIVWTQNEFILGTNRGLVSIESKPSLFTPLPRPEGVNDEDLFSIRNIMRLDDQHLLIGGYRGTFILNEATNEFKALTYEFSTDKNPLGYDFIKYQDQVFIATEGNGLLILNPLTKQLSPFLTDQEYQNLGKRFKPGKWSISIFVDSQNQIWMGSYGGVYKVDPEQKKISVLQPGGRDIFANNWIYDFAEDSLGELWIATRKGLFSYHQESDSLQNHTVSNIPELGITSILIDGHYIWVGSLGEGLKKIDSETGKIETYTTREGLCDNYIRGMLIDPSGNLWISTNRGLSRFDPDQELFRNYFEEDGLTSNVFNHKACLKDENGQLYFGGYNGLFQINLQQVYSNTSGMVPDIKISKFSEHQDHFNRITSNIFNAHLQKELVIPHQDQFFTIYFSAGFYNPEKINFIYQLTGIHDAWQELKSNNFIQFAALPAGNYQLKVKGSYDGGPFSEPLLLNIKINQATYFTWWAYLIYAVMILSIIVLGIRLYYKKQQIMHRLGVEKLVTNKLIDLDKTKTRFFTNFAHEIRTPLNLITAPANELFKKVRSPELKTLSRQILRNAEAVENLLTQVLLLNKLESGKIKLNKEKTDLVQFIKKSVAYFQQLSFYKKIGMEFYSDFEECIVEIDSEKFKDVMNNLISNALKFTDSGGEIMIALIYTPDQVEISIRDTGIGIPKNDLSHIFDRYFQSNGSEKQSGLGIGLAYVKELVLAHQGQIKVESEENLGSNFILGLPMVSYQPVAASPVIEKTKRHLDPGTVVSINHSEKPRMLIIEDHHELATYMIRHLDQYFTISHATDGNQGLNEVKRFNPEVIVTDIMLPKMDGITLINRLKADEKTNTIPIIILSAKDNLESRIEGYREGAILYLTKPFQIEELKLAAENLISNQKMAPLAQNYLVTAEESYHQKFLELVDKNLSDPDFTISKLVKLLGTSRTQLHRKLKQLTGNSPLSIIKSIKMEKSYQMLKQGKTIKEVTYATGYSSTSQFSKTFKDFFGNTPFEIKKGVEENQKFKTNS